MKLGLTESKEDSNFCFKVEGGRLVMLLLCVDALFPRHGGVAECICNFLGTKEIYGRDLEKIQDDGLQGHDHTYGIEPEAIE